MHHQISPEHKPEILHACNKGKKKILNASEDLEINKIATTNTCY